MFNPMQLYLEQNLLLIIKKQEVMKTISKLLLVLCISLCYSCNKENQAPVSEFFNEYEGWSSKDIIVTDNDETNSAYFTIYGKTEEILDDFIQSHSLLLVNEYDNTIFKNSETNSQEQPNIVKPEDEDLQFYNLEDEPSIVISHITSNLINGENGFLLEVQRKKLKSGSDWIHGYTYGYETTESFIGLVHWEGLYPVIVNHRWLNCWLCFWQHNEYSYWVGRYFGIYWYKYDWNSHYKRGLTVRHHLYQPEQPFPYYIAYQSEDFRGNQCEIGSWDTRNCYVGTAPTGTTAFMWPDNRGTFYYTPLPGNQCQSGHWFDGAHCVVIDIPGDKTYGFIFQNKWYVKANMIGS
jgi:hypothetical protein